MRPIRLAFGCVLGLLSISAAYAQTLEVPAGTRINQYGVTVGTTPGTVAGGDALAAEIAARIAALTTKPTLGADGTLSAQTVKPTGSSSTHTLADTAAAALNSAQLNTSNCVIVPTTTWTVCPSGGNAVTLSIAGVPQATYGLDASSHPYQRMGSN